MVYFIFLYLTYITFKFILKIFYFFEKSEPILLRPNPYFGIKYTLTFPSNPGKLEIPRVNFDTNDMRNTLLVKSISNTTKYGK
jgi:hypothetical protein